MKKSVVLFIIVLLASGCITPPTGTIKEYIITKRCTMPGYSRDVYIDGNYAYIANGQGGLQIVNLDSLKIISSVNLQGYIRGVIIVDTFAYLAAGSEGFAVVNISDNYTPVSVGFDSWFTAYDLQFSGEFVYIAASYWFIEEDITHPDFPSYKRRCSTKGDARGIYVDGRYVYVACEEMGIMVIDLENPDSLARIGYCDTPSNARDVFVSNGYAYVADGNGGLHVLDVSEPENLFIVASCDFNGYANKVFVKDNQAYVAAGDGGLKVLDVSNPGSPYLYGECETPYASSVFVESIIYIADRDIGLLVIEPVD